MPHDTDYRNLYLFPTSAAQCYIWKDGNWQFLYNNPFHTRGELEYSSTRGALHETGLDRSPPQLWGEQTEDRGTQITWSALGQQAPVEEKQKWDPDREKTHTASSGFAAAATRFFPSA